MRNREHLLYIGNRHVIGDRSAFRSPKLAIDGELIVICSSQLTISGTSVVPRLAFIRQRSPLLFITSGTMMVPLWYD